MRTKRMRGSKCDPPYLGLIAGYCGPCGTQFDPVWPWLPNVVLVLDVYHNTVMVARSFLLAFNINLTAIGAILDYLELLR